MKRFAYFVTLTVTVSLAFSLFILSGCTTPVPTKTVTPDAKGVYPTQTPVLTGDTQAPTVTLAPYSFIPTVEVRTPERHIRLRAEPVNIIDHIGTVVPREGYVFISCYLYLVSYADDSFKVGPEFFIVTDSDLNKYSSVPWSLEPAFAQGILTSGSDKSGFITFEVPETAHNLLLSMYVILPTESFMIRTQLGH
jgi:hypothetical protein